MNHYSTPIGKEKNNLYSTCAAVRISNSGTGKELCDWLILLLAFPIPINLFALDHKLRNHKRKRFDTFNFDAVELKIPIMIPVFDFR